MSKLSDLTGQALRDLIGNMAYSKGGLAIGTAPAGINTTAAISYSVNGVLPAAKAAMTSQSITVTHTDDGRMVGGGITQQAPAVAVPFPVTVYYTLGLNAAGAVSVSQGTYAGQLLPIGQNGTSYAGDGSVPNAPAGYVPFGVVKVTSIAGAAGVLGTAFIPGTTALNAAGITATFFDIAVMPAGLL